jgi:hypothetical protein
MEAKENKRLKEIKLSIYINHIDKIREKATFSKFIRLLNCVALTISHDASIAFTNLWQVSVCDGFARATHKELYAAIKTFFTTYKIPSKLGISGTVFYRRFGDVISTNYINDDYLESLKPLFNYDASYIMVNVLNTFIDGFKLPRVYSDSKLEGNKRTLELDFMLIYDKLMDVFNNTMYVDTLIRNVCDAFDINYPTIAHLKNNIHVISRMYPRFVGNNKYLVQELVTLYTYRGYKKGTIGSKVLGKGSSYLFTPNMKKVSEVMSDDDLVWQYCPTVDWEGLDKSSVVRFIELFRMFSDYDV